MNIELVFERPITIPLKENTAEAAIASAIALSEQPYGVKYDPQKTTRLKFDDVVIRVDSESKLKQIWWEWYLTKNNRIKRDDGVVPHPKKIDKDDFYKLVYYVLPREKFSSAEEAVADYEAAYKEG